MEKDKEEIIPGTPAEEVVPVEPEPTAAERIAALWSFVGEIDGEPFNPKNKDHIIIASFLVGKNNMLRRL